MKDYMEKPFELLKKKDGSFFSTETIDNWYKARAFVLNKIGKFAFKADDDAHLHIVVDGDSNLMLAVARQAALSAHYINHVEDLMDESKRRRSVITIVSQSGNIVSTLKKEEYLNELLNYCKYTLDGKKANAESYIDVEFEFVENTPEIDTNNTNIILIKESDVISFCDKQPEEIIYCIDTRKAQYAGRMYDLGVLIDNLPSENIHDAHRYTLALDFFQYDRLLTPLGKLINKEKWENLIKAKNSLSNIFCADCFESRERSIELSRENDSQADAELWEKYNKALSMSEHARWVVEKLIMGFRPFNEVERLEDERLSPYKAKRKQYRNDLKNKAKSPAHIDLCSYNTLRRTNPDDLKYDSFLMLAIPKILEKIRKEDE